MNSAKDEFRHGEPPGFSKKNQGNSVAIQKKMKKQPALYILSSKRNGTLYTGVSSNLLRRIYEHKEGIYEGFSKKYGCKSLVYYELLDSMAEAISRETQIKKGSRKNKIELIENYPCNSKEELTAREGYHIKQKNCVNKKLYRVGVKNNGIKTTPNM